MIGIVAQAPDYLVLYKPHAMHTVPLKAGEGGTLLEEAASRFPEIALVHGKKNIEGGILHRLDFETEGLVLAARNEAAFQSLSRQQAEGLFVKEYDAVSSKQTLKPAGFPPFAASLPPAPFTIESAFRAYGPGRRAVRPVSEEKSKKTGAGKKYKTEVLSMSEGEGEGAEKKFHIRLTRGFRHQVRCHLAWLGFPIVNDPLYGGANIGGALALKAAYIQFFDPFSGEAREYRC
ncbi:MAG: RNA pseudouridine synthase [Spirochaetaceae bacterium]|jgi:23S rRNA pseudouridine1911/1915/1917 synthase|nr:RNA pseudouridine synthase [Spirochaetaceae bacterium]